MSLKITWHSQDSVHSEQRIKLTDNFAKFSNPAVSTDPSLIGQKANFYPFT